MTERITVGSGGGRRHGAGRRGFFAQVGRINAAGAVLTRTLLILVIFSGTVNGQERPQAKIEGRIVNVHEHLASIAQLAPLLGAMDAVGIRKTVLLGSPSFTFTLNPSTAFAGYEANNDVLLQAVAKHPDRFDAWPVIDPEDPDKVEKLKAYLQKGATGLKLYLGHGYRKRGSGDYLFHKMPLDDPRMVPLYEYVEANNVPVMYHVNPGPTRPGFAEEFVAVLKRFPKMKVIAPHFILSSIKDSRLREFLDTFPNLYSDISFGRDPYLKGGLTRISKHPDKFRRLFEKYPERFMFGTDVVVTNSEMRTEDWLAERFRAYVAMLSEKEYQAVIGRTLRLKGLDLPAALRDGILYGNFEAFMAKKPVEPGITRQIDWTRMGIEKTRNSAGKELAAAGDQDWAVLEKQAREDADPKVRSSAVDELGRKDDEARALLILAEVLKKDPVAEVRDDALSAIEFFDPVPRAPVLDRLVADPSPDLRLRAMEIVEDEEWQGADVEKALANATEDSDAEVRRQAVGLLGEIEAWKTLERIANEHQNEEVRGLAAEELEDR